MIRIYLVEDENDLAQLVLKYLVKEGYEAVHFSTGELAMQAIADEPDLWILDIMLPGTISGYDLIKTIKRNKHATPIIFTSARDKDIDRIMGLEMGGNDYLSKPYSLRELMLRIKNVLQKTIVTNPNLIQYETYEIDTEKRTVKTRDGYVNLTSKEFDLMFFLIQNQGKAFSRDQILDSIWGYGFIGSDRVVDDLMRRLRHKMPMIRVETLYGYGYRLS